MNILCCDDNEEHLTQLMKQVRELYGENDYRVQGFTTTAALLAAVSDTTDIILSDILLDNDNGITAMKSVQGRFPHIQIIFISAYPSYCEDVYQVDHVAYLQKPVSTPKLEAVLAKAVSKAQKEREHYITIKSKSLTATVHMGKILYIETVGRQINIVTEDKFYSVAGKNSILLKLDDRFIDCGKGCTVNMSKVRTLGRQTLTMSDGKEVVLTADRYPAVKQACLRFLGERL